MYAGTKLFFNLMPLGTDVLSESYPFLVYYKFALYFCKLGILPMLVCVVYIVLIDLYSS